LMTDATVVFALAFAADEIPDDYDRVAGFFRRRGAYGHFKDLLEMRGKLERWYVSLHVAPDRRRSSGSRGHRAASGWT